MQLVLLCIVAECFLPLPRLHVFKQVRVLWKLCPVFFLHSGSHHFQPMRLRNGDGHYLVGSVNGRKENADRLVKKAALTDGRIRKAI